MMKSAKNRLERLERAVASEPDRLPVPDMIRRVVGADGRYTGEEYRSTGGGPWVRSFNPERAGTIAPGTVAAREEAAG